MKHKMKQLLDQLATVSSGTWARLALLTLSLVNAGLNMYGVNTCAIAQMDISMGISIAFVVLCAFLAYWKNNSFTAAAQAADEMLRSLRAKVPQAP